MRICFRADGSSFYGLGHIVRSLAIAGELRRAGAEVVFITEDDRVALQKIRHAGFEVDVKPPGACNDAYTRRAFFEHNADILVIDIKHYDFGAGYIRNLRGWRGPVVMIDPQCLGRDEASLVVYTNGHMGGYGAPYGLKNVYWGAEYTVMNPKVIEAGQAPRDGGPPQILITTGGSDPKNILTQVLRMLPPHTPSDYTIYAKPGEAFMHTAEMRDAFNALPRHSFYYSGNEPITHAICTFGVTAYEMAYLGIPCLTIAHSEENIWGSRNFAELGMGCDGGHYKDLTPAKFNRLLNELIDPGHKWRPIEGLDGKGAERVARLILEVEK